MIRPGALKKFAIVSPAPCDWLLKRGTLLIGMSPLFNWPHRLSGKTIKNGRRNMRDEAANKIFKIDAATLAMCACTRNPKSQSTPRRQRREQECIRSMACIYVYIYIHIYVYKRAATKEAETTQRKIGESFVLSETEKASDFVAKLSFGY